MNPVIKTNSTIHPGTSVFEQIFFVICHPQQSKSRPMITSTKANVGTLLFRIINMFVTSESRLNNLAHTFGFVQI